MDTATDAHTRRPNETHTMPMNASHMFAPARSLEGQVALVTGGARGIGRAKSECPHTRRLGLCASHADAYEYTHKHTDAHGDTDTDAHPYQDTYQITYSNHNENTTGL